MLDTDTKRRIDTASDILMGKFTLIDVKTLFFGHLADKYHSPDDPLPDHSPRTFPGAPV